MFVVNVTVWPLVLLSFTHGLGGNVKYMTQPAFLVLTQHFKIIPSLFLSLKEFKDEKNPDVCTLCITIGVLYTHLFTERMAQYSMAPEANLSASKFSRVKQNIA